MIGFPPHSFFFKKEKVDLGVMRLSKFKSSKDWFLECAVWHSSGGRINTHIPLGHDKNGWLVFQDLLSVFLLLSLYFEH